jgi:hypothetical protein
MVICGVLLLAGVAAGAQWGDRPFVTPVREPELSAIEAARRFVWYASIALVVGIGAGVTVIGCGGRLAMRLLAATSGDAAQGRTTEADEVVGKITAGGTIGFVIFIGILGGVSTAVLYLVVRRFLPDGWLGGIVFGLGLLAVFGTTIDPLRDQNPDFDLVGPGWLAVVVFIVLAVALGVTVAGLAARLSTWLPLPSAKRRVLLRYVVPAALAAFAYAVTVVILVLGLAVVAATRWRSLVSATRSHRAVVVGRVVTITIAAAALPNAVISVAHIATS